MGKRTIKVFLASPGDLAPERRAFRERIQALNLGFGDGAGVEFVPCGWEDLFATTGHRPQSVINAEIDGCDVFVLALGRWWGQPAPDSSPLSSYTEEEFHRALTRWRESGSPVILIFFKDIDAASLADPGEQLKNVLTFRREVEKSRLVLYRRFANADDFASEVDSHLRAFVKGELPKPDSGSDALILPVEYIERVNAAEALAAEQVKEAEKTRDLVEQERLRAEKAVLSLAKAGARAAEAGQVVEARELFAQAVASTTNLPVLRLAWEFYVRTGELQEARKIGERWLAIAGEHPSRELGAGLIALGIALAKQGDLDGSEVLYRKALYIANLVADAEISLDVLGNLANVLHERGRLQEAETIYRRVLRERQVREDWPSIAATHGNLGVLLKTRAAFEEAEEQFEKSTELYRCLGDEEGRASALSNLATLVLRRGDVATARTLVEEAREVAERLRNMEMLAACHQTLGVVFQEQGLRDKAEEEFQRALDIHSRFGETPGMVNALGGIANLLQERGDLNGAEGMYRRAIDVDERLRRPEGLAASYSNLAGVLAARGELDDAEAALRQSIDWNASLGRTDGLAIAYSNLGKVLEAKGDVAGARTAWSRSSELFDAVGLAADAKRVRGKLRRLGN